MTSPTTRTEAPTGLSRRVHSITLALLLVGSLLPSSVPVVLATAIIAVPMVTWQILKTLPIVHPAVRFAGPVFGVLAFAALVVPPAAGYGSDKFTRLVTLTLLSALAAALIRDRTDLHVFAVVWVITGCLITVLILTGEQHAGRAIGYGGNPIWLGRATGSALVATGWLLVRRHGSPWLLAPAAAFLAYGTYATGSRGPLIASIIGLVLMLICATTNRVARVATIGACALAAAWVVALFPMTAESRVEMLLTDPGAELEGSSRPELFTRTLPVIADHPFGVGYGNWAPFAHGWPFLYPHNIWAEVTTEAGWLAGATLILAAIVVITRLARASRHDSTARLTLGLLAFEIISVSVSGDLNARTFFAMLTLGHIVAAWSRPATRLGSPSPSTSPATRPSHTPSRGLLQPKGSYSTPGHHD